MGVPYAVDDYMPISPDVGEIELTQSDVPTSNVIVCMAIAARLEWAQNMVAYITDVDTGS